MHSVQAKLEEMQRLLYEVRREVAEAEIERVHAQRSPLGLDGRLAVESYHEQRKAHSRGPGV